jgi:hypothetical protein
MQVKIGDSKEELSKYYPFALVDGRSIHLEKMPDGTFSVWDSKRVKKGLSQRESLDFCDKIYQDIKNGM